MKLAPAEQESANAPCPSTLRDTVILVTGASGGIGGSVARSLAALGARVVLSGRQRAALDALRTELAAANASSAQVVTADLREADAPARLVAAAAEWGGRLDGIISCAGGARFTFFSRLSPDEFDAALRVNLLAPIEIVRAALPFLKSSERGRIVFVNSIAAREPAPPRGTAYLSAKAGLLHFAESLFAEIRDTGIAVTSILPDLANTPMIPQELGYDPASLISPESVAKAVIFAATCPQDVCVTELHLRPQPSLRRIRT